MIVRCTTRALQNAARQSQIHHWTSTSYRLRSSSSVIRSQPASSILSTRSTTQIQRSNFHSTRHHNASSVSADEIMENLTELYATAKDEFEIASEETEKQTVYAASDREGAREALTLLKEAFEKAVTESGPDVGKEIQTRVGQRIRELESAVVAMEESAIEH